MINPSQDLTFPPIHALRNDRAPWQSSLKAGFILIARVRHLIELDHFYLFQHLKGAVGMGQ